MKGSIRQRNNSWEITLDRGKDENGKRQRFYETRNSKKEAEKRLRELLTENDKGIPLPGKETVGDILNQWIKGKHNVSDRTLYDYEGVLRRYLLPLVGSIPLSRLTPQDVHVMHAKMFNSGLSSRSVEVAHKVLSQALKQAVRWGVLGRNVCELIDKPRSSRKQMRALDTYEIQRLMEACEDSPYRHIFFLATFTGLRRGELLALRWIDLDLKSRKLSVNRSLRYVAGKGISIEEPKTKYSRRMFTMPKSVVNRLTVLKAQQVDIFEAHRLPWDESRFVFGDIDNELPFPDTVTKEFKTMIEKAWLKPARFHDLRHTCASLMLRAGINPKIVSAQLGHASVAITLDIYSHILPSVDEEAAEVFDQSLSTMMNVGKLSAW